MQITKKTRNKKKFITLIVLAALLALTAGGLIYYLYSKKPSESVNYEPATAQEQAAGNATKKETVAPQSGESQTTTQKTTPDTSADGTPAKTPQAQNTTVRITAKSQNGNLYQIRTIIEGVFADGTCTLTATRAQQIVTKTASIQPLAQSSTCQGFDIPTTELTPGTWSVQLSFVSNQSSGSTSDTVEVK